MWRSAVRALPVVIAAVSFAIYAIAVLTLDQGRSTSFVLEEDGPFPAALSYERYGTRPNGMVDDGVNRFFERALAAGEPVGRVLDEAAAGPAIATGQVGLTKDGTGVGGLIMAEMAFGLFGLKAQALAMFFLTLVGLSASAFIMRYRDQRMSAVPILLLGLTLVLLTPMSIDASFVAQAPVGGLRYYVVLGILPTLHWCLEFLDHGNTPAKPLRWGLLGIQVTVLGLTILVRSSPAYLIGPPVVCAAWVLWRQPGQRRRRNALLLLLPAALLYMELTALPKWAFPEYAAAGRLYGTVWHRLFVSFGVNPAWPFPGVRERYQCADRGIPEGIMPGLIDRNAHCVWLSYAHAHDVSLRPAIDGLYGKQYEKVLRSEFLLTVRQHPREAFLTFFYYKPVALSEMIFASTLRWGEAATLTAGLCLLQIFLFSAFVFARPSPTPLREAGRQMGLLLLFSAFALAPQLVAWPNFSTVPDIIAYRLCAYAVVMSMAVAAIGRLLCRWPLRARGRGFPRSGGGELIAPGRGQ
jgi:hypothetical protein